MSSIVFRSLADPDFQELFNKFTQSSFRLETLQNYDVEYEDQAFADFRAGKTRYISTGHNEWVKLIAKQVAARRVMSRVHVVKLPLSEYVKFEVLWPYRDSIEAGEDIRLIPINHDGWPEGLPQFDYWLFDDKVIAVMHYLSDGKFDRVELSDDKKLVLSAIEWRRLAMLSSLTYEEFVSQYLGRWI